VAYFEKSKHVGDPIKFYTEIQKVTQLETSRKIENVSKYSLTNFEDQISWFQFSKSKVHQFFKLKHIIGSIKKVSKIDSIYTEKFTLD